MGFSCGIVGLPNVGKSTIFNALTSAKAAAANFPFCTIEPNTGSIPVPDARLQVLADIAGSEKILPTQVTFVDIAGLIKGASTGEGLGNQFLGHIRSVDAIAHVVRCFSDSDVVHVEGTVDPIRDIEIIETELLLSDLDALQKAKLKIDKLARGGDSEAKLKLAAINELDSHLSKGNHARTIDTSDWSAEALEVMSSLITAKPVLYVANVDEDKVTVTPDPAGSSPVDKVAAYAQEKKCSLVLISGKVESEIAELPLAERKEYLDSLGLHESGLDRLAVAGYNLLNILTFFTVGPKETHAWTAAVGSKAPQCAGKIHSDFEKGFIRAEIMSYSDYVQYKGEVKAREAGRLRVEGKEYVVQDGDVVHFRFNV